MATPRHDSNSPISTVPPEVLSEILLISTDFLPKPDPDKPPLLFTRISRRFRHVALTTPRLWSDIHLPATYGSCSPQEGPNYDRYLGLISDWLLVHSGRLPLNIEFAAIGDATPNTVALFDLFLSCRSRWQNIKLYMANPSLLSYITVLDETDVPCLRALSLNFYGYHYPPVDPANSRIVMAPNLRKLELSSQDRWTLNADMSWANLTDVSLQKNIVGPIIPFLSQARCLRSLSFNTASLLDDNIATSAIYLPDLFRLQIWGEDHWDRLNMLLVYLQAPSLEVLTLYAFGIGGRETTVVDLISRTTRLKTFDIPDIDYDSLVQILRYTPDLQELHIGNQHLTKEQSNNFLNIFVGEDTSERFCSHLEVLDCTFRLDPDDDTVRRLYNRKLGHTAGICAWKKCQVRFTEQRSVDLLRQLVGGDKRFWVGNSKFL